jgi:signal transduction histidine kinase
LIMKISFQFLLSQLIAILAGILLSAWLLKALNFEVTVPAVALLATLFGCAFGFSFTYPLTRRLSRLGEIAQAWNRGNLSLRVADPRQDELGQMAEQFDQLAEHLEQDERDLDELCQRNSRLTDQVRALTVVEERNRLARELHDSVKQYLFSLAMTASAIRSQLDRLDSIPEELKQMVVEVQDSAQTAQRETTRLIEDLRPGSLHERGLAAALNDFTLLFGAQEHLLVYLEVQGKEPLLPPSIAEAFYRVAQEALHNVARHAQATRADLHLQYLPGHVRLTLRDNGVGFEVQRPQRGLGLANMQERMLEIGGRLDIESRLGSGTKISVEVGLVDPRTRKLDIAEKEQTALIPTIDHWPWLGQKLVIPVGQTWPWLPADTVHLRQPLVEIIGTELIFQPEQRWLWFGWGCRFQIGSQPNNLVRIRHTWKGYTWRCDGARWRLRNYGGLSRRMVLFRNGQPVAAMQYRGRQMHNWSEIVYDGRGYRISQDHDDPQRYALKDQAGDLLLIIHDGVPLEIRLERPLPVHLILLVFLRIFEENQIVSSQ